MMSTDYFLLYYNTSRNSICIKTYLQRLLVVGYYYYSHTNFFFNGTCNTELLHKWRNYQSIKPGLTKNVFGKWLSRAYTMTIVSMVDVDKRLVFRSFVLPIELCVFVNISFIHMVVFTDLDYIYTACSVWKNQL